MKYESYQKGLDTLNLENLEERRLSLCLRFAQKCTKNPKTQNMFPLKKKKHIMNIRKTEKYEVQHANTDRLRKSSIIFMQNLLNQHEK